ncbi:Transposase and inactivated derivatives [Actinomyces slackii]|uniref:Uncharacterized protein n=1 Tax=Actinomyces slackii TaxID=52774 RepID=A0A3S4U418_9ACTO|nr:Uncharacterised protein [Actinomyces slackii]VEG75970.1 Uncharacterised protein [Actinomyces slackii]
MSKPVDPRIRLAIANWPADAPRGAVASLGAEHAISRNTFYKLRRRAEQMGQAAVLEPLSRRPQTSPTALGQEVKDQAVSVRAALAASGLDHGPVSVHDKMRQMGLDNRVPGSAGPPVPGSGPGPGRAVQKAPSGLEAALPRAQRLLADRAPPPTCQAAAASAWIRPAHR